MDDKELKARSQELKARAETLRPAVELELQQHVAIHLKQLSERLGAPVEAVIRSCPMSATEARQRLPDELCGLVLSRQIADTGYSHTLAVEITRLDTERHVLAAHLVIAVQRLE